MDQFTPQIIANALLICVVLFLAVRGFVRWCKRVDSRPAYDPMRDGPERQQDEENEMDITNGRNAEAGLQMAKQHGYSSVAEFNKAMTHQAKQWRHLP